jgi:hypothetical protein
MVEKKSSNQFTVKWTEEDKPLRENFEKEKEKQKSNMQTLRVKLKENIDMKKAISEKDKELKELREKLTYVEDYANGKKEELYKKVTTFPFHNKCYDMLLVEGNPDARECICPPSKRPVPIPKDKKTGRYFVYDSRICGRCLALDLRKTTERPTQKKEPESSYPVKQWCKRDKQLFTEGEKDCYNCKWLTTECLVKRRIVLNG